MDYSIIIGITGILATLVFGFLSIDLFRKKRYPGKITYVKLSLIDLLNNVATNFEEIQLLHNKLPINKNIIYIKGAILNNGYIDINSSITEKDITIELPENSKWLDIKPTKFSKSLSVIINIDSEKARSASFDFDLFRKNEFVQFEGLIESDDDEMTSDNLESKMKFSHRIENTSKVEKKKLLSKKEVKKKKNTALTYSVILLITIFIVTYMSLFNFSGKSSESLYFKHKNNTSVELYKVRLQNSKVKLSPIFGNEIIYLTPNEFNLKYIPSLKQLTLYQKFKEQYLILSLQIAVFLILVIIQLLEINKARKLTQILDN